MDVSPVPSFRSQTWIALHYDYLFLSLVDKQDMSYNPLILPSTGRILTLETLWVPNSILGSQEVNLPRDLVLGRTIQMWEQGTPGQAHQTEPVIIVL